VQAMSLAVDANFGASATSPQLAHASCDVLP
jgi:hypothetical protein